jgi:putative protein kinase ArgK-like GTPase of G3E family
VARLGTGVPELRTELERHRQFLLGPEGRERRRSRVRRRIESIVRERLFSELRALSGTDGSLEAHTAAVEDRSEDPMAAAEALLSALRAGGRKE